MADIIAKPPIETYNVSVDPPITQDMQPGIVDLAIDCEWNGYKGELISIALVPFKKGILPFYQELIRREKPDPWVEENVLPKLDGKGVDEATFQQELRDYLNPFQGIRIWADWHEDIRYYCDAIVIGPGKCLSTPFTTMMVVPIDDPNVVSKVPHHALHDAIANRDHYQKFTFSAEFVEEFNRLMRLPLIP